MEITSKRVDNKIWREFVTDFSSLGSLAFHVVAGIFLLVLDKNLFLKFAITLGATYFLLFIFRISFFSKRPIGRSSYNNLFEKADNNSMFSSHTASSFAFALTIGLNTMVIILIFLLVFATLIAASRIYLKKHYPKHIFAGLIIGVATGLIINLILF